MKKLALVWTVLIGIGVTSAFAGGLQCAVDAAIQGKSAVSIEWAGHTFDIQPVEAVDKQKGMRTLTGTLLHRNGKKEKQTVAYRITREKRVLKTIELQIDGGAWLSLSPEMSAALGDYRTTTNIDEKKRATIHQALYKTGEASWQKTAELIVALIAIHHPQA